MPNTRELLSSSDFQMYLIANAERWFDTERLCREPLVVFDAGEEDFWVTATNSVRRDAIFAAVRSGQLIPVNADALTDIAHNHAMLHIYLAESGRNIPTIPTYVSIAGLPHLPEKPPAGARMVGEHSPAVIPSVYVKKYSYKDGRSTAHGGEGVSVVRVTQENAREHLPRSIFEFLQPFIIPPGPYVRDIRVYMVGGTAAAGVIRCARQPLRAVNLAGLVLPTRQQYPSAQCPGPSEPLDGDLRNKVFASALKVYEVLDTKVRARKRPFSPYSTWGYGSIDFLLDSNAVPLPTDFDLNPSVTSFEEIDQTVAERLAEYLCVLASVGGVDRRVMVIGYPYREFIQLLLTNLANKLPRNRIIFQEALVSQATAEKPQRHGV